MTSAPAGVSKCTTLPNTIAAAMVAKNFVLLTTAIPAFQSALCQTAFHDIGTRRVSDPAKSRVAAERWRLGGLHRVRSARVIHKLFVAGSERQPIAFNRPIDRNAHRGCVVGGARVRHCADTCGDKTTKQASGRYLLTAVVEHVAHGAASHFRHCTLGRCSRYTRSLFPILP
jgi:hypothetical protein